MMLSSHAILLAIMFTSPPIGPYTSARDYLRLMPQYAFQDKSDITIVAQSLVQVAPMASIIADCGAGPCRIESALPPSIRTVHAVEPNKLMWIPRERCIYHKLAAPEFLLTTHLHFDAVLWLWSLNYPLLDLYETYDPATGLIYQKDWSVADTSAKQLLQDIFSRHQRCAHLIMFFDDDSEEQRFVTETWTKIAPFPYGRRSYTREILEFVLDRLRVQGLFHIGKFHYHGIALYGEIEVAFEKMMRFHLKCRFDNDTETVERVMDFLRCHLQGDTVTIPSGAYLYIVEPL